jgi:hypothetical protein
VSLEAQVVGAHAWIHVRDEGIGIAPRNLEHILGKFERAVPERHYGGLGLGHRPRVQDSRPSGLSGGGELFPRFTGCLYPGAACATPSRFKSSSTTSTARTD